MLECGCVHEGGRTRYGTLRPRSEEWRERFTTDGGILERVAAGATYVFARVVLQPFQPSCGRRQANPRRAPGCGRTPDTPQHAAACGHGHEPGHGPLALCSSCAAVGLPRGGGGGPADRGAIAADSTCSTLHGSVAGTPGPRSRGSPASICASPPRRPSITSGSGSCNLVAELKDDMQRRGQRLRGLGRWGVDVL